MRILAIRSLDILSLAYVNINEVAKHIYLANVLYIMFIDLREQISVMKTKLLSNILVIQRSLKRMH